MSHFAQEHGCLDDELLLANLENEIPLFFTDSAGEVSELGLPQQIVFVAWVFRHGLDPAEPAGLVAETLKSLDHKVKHDGIHVRTPFHEKQYHA